jgi:hypothetical protein
MSNSPALTRSLTKQCQSRMQTTDNLSIEEYDRAEAQAIRRASYPAIRAFRPAAFSLANFPIRVTDERELIRYCDIVPSKAN